MESSNQTVGPQAPQSSSGMAGRMFLAFLGLSLAAMGSIFVAVMWRSYDRAREMHQWPEIPCVILEAEVVDRATEEQFEAVGAPPEYRLNLLYGYQWQGESKTGTRITWRGNPWTSKRNVIESLAKDYPVGKQTTCRVNPEDPDFTVLKPDSKTPGYSIWFPALFVIGGLGITIRALTAHRKPNGDGSRE